MSVWAARSTAQWCLGARWWSKSGYEAKNARFLNEVAENLLKQGLLCAVGLGKRRRASGWRMMTCRSRETRVESSRSERVMWRGDFAALGKGLRERGEELLSGTWALQLLRKRCFCSEGVVEVGPHQGSSCMTGELGDGRRESARELCVLGGEEKYSEHLAPRLGSFTCLSSGAPLQGSGAHRLSAPQGRVVP